MRIIVSLTAALVVCSTTAHADSCSTGRSDVLILEEWSGKEAEFGSTRVSMQLRNTTDHDVRMIKGSVRFTDPFGEMVANLQLDPDVEILSGSTYTETGMYRAARLARVNPRDISATVCVEGMVRGDGTVEDYR